MLNQCLTKMSFVYVIIENGEAYPSAYTSYEQARGAVQDKWGEEVQRQLDEEGTCSFIDLPENSSGKTSLYVEKGINIEILKLPVASK